MQSLLAIAAQLVAALGVSGVVMVGLGFGQPIHSKLLVLLLAALPVGGAVWLAGRVLDRGCNWRALIGAILGGAVGYLLIMLEVPHRLTRMELGVDSFWWFTLVSCLPVTAGYWLARGRAPTFPG